MLKISDKTLIISVSGIQYIPYTQKLRTEYKELNSSFSKQQYIYFLTALFNNSYLLIFKMYNYICNVIETIKKFSEYQI